MSVKNERPTFRALVELYETHFVYSMNQKLTLWKVLYKPLSSTLWNVSSTLWNVLNNCPNFNTEMKLTTPTLWNKLYETNHTLWNRIHEATFFHHMMQCHGAVCPHDGGECPQGCFWPSKKFTWQLTGGGRQKHSPDTARPSAPLHVWGAMPHRNRCHVSCYFCYFSYIWTHFSHL